MAAKKKGSKSAKKVKAGAKSKKWSFNRSSCGDSSSFVTLPKRYIWILKKNLSFSHSIFISALVQKMTHLFFKFSNR